MLKLLNPLLPCETRKLWKRQQFTLASHRQQNRRRPSRSFCPLPAYLARRTKQMKTSSSWCCSQTLNTFLLFFFFALFREYEAPPCDTEKRKNIICREGADISPTNFLALCAELLGSPINELIFMILMRRWWEKRKQNNPNKERND